MVISCMQAHGNLLHRMLRMLEVEWSSGDECVLSLVGPPLMDLLDSERAIEQEIRVEALRALSCALLRAAQVCFIL